MTKTTKLFGLLIALGLPSPGIATAQSMASQTPASEPCLWRNVVMGGGGFVTGIIVHPRERGLMYARTDVGGAYRWDSPAQKWVPITDWIGAADDNLFGIESIALDPRDPSRVYLAAGTYSGGNAAILRSDDRGKTFQRTDVPFKMGGNETGRFNGERLAVDPSLGNILFFGSRRDGLWKSADRGATWAKVETFPGINSISPASETSSTNARPDFGFGLQQAVGIIAVVFDPSSGQPGAPTPVLFAAVSAIGTNIYASADAGLSWQAVTNQPIGLRPNHLVRSADGIFYVTYGREPGPATMTDGAVWKFNPKDGVWTDITPVKPKESNQRFGYGGVSVDARHPSTIMVTTFDHWNPRDEIFRSTNGGGSWGPLVRAAVWDHSNAPYTAARTPHWMGDIQINPFDSDQVLFTTGYGIWSCTDATQADAGKPTHWVFLDRGLEETVPLALISPPEGAHLLSGVADIDGFRHEDLNVSPAKGTFAGPHFFSTESLEFAGKSPLVVVRTGTGGPRVHAAISEDGGQTWKALDSEPTNSRGGDSIALSADGKIIVWTPRRGSPCVSADRGTTWTACAGLANGFRVIADPVNPARFYSFDPREGKLLASADGAARFVSTGASFAPMPGGGRFGGGGGGSLYAAPGLEGDLWMAFRNNGLHHSTDGGTNFARLDRVEAADALGFGKPAPGKSFPALYLAGSIGRLRALFRSDDAGQSWVRINDDQHQFGHISHVTGDPRIYGRVYCATGGRGVVYGDLAAGREPEPGNP
jgi:photosystem II stability/assembly factor-like uncharacterized protein